MKAQEIEFNAPPYKFADKDGSPDLTGLLLPTSKDTNDIQLEIFEPTKFETGGYIISRK